MVEIMYHPKDVGKEVVNGHGKKTKIRKYHMTEEDIKRSRKKWLETIKDIDIRTVRRAGNNFFNPYRRGIYYYQIYAMFLLGCNKWHRLSHIVKKMEQIMSEVSAKENGVMINVWDKFKCKARRADSTKSKDYIGRIQENMIFFQRLSTFHPYGYKLKQVCAAVDIKRVTKRGFPNGVYYYRLSTYACTELALPLRDYSKFVFPRHERKYVSYKFIGTIVTADKVISEGKIDEVSQM